MRVVLAGGGTAGHVEPALALADALVRLDPEVEVSALGTASGLEAQLVPARGYRLLEIPRVPLPRRPSADLVRVPTRLVEAVRRAGQHLEQVQADVLVGFGGYVALPGYLAARRRGTPFVVHEANARAGLANKVGARLTPYVAAAAAGCGLPHVRPVGIPLRLAVSSLDRAGRRAEARAAFGLAELGPVLLVTGGSQGARRLNAAVTSAAADLAAAGISVLHVAGAHGLAEVQAALGPHPPASHQVVGYVAAMELAYAAADLALCRAGAMTCAELSAVGLPGVYVPLPIGNGEQALNAEPVVAAGGGLLVEDSGLDADWLRQHLLPLLLDPVRLHVMGERAAGLGRRGADVALAELVRTAADR